MTSASQSMYHLQASVISGKFMGTSLSWIDAFLICSLGLFSVFMSSHLQNQIAIHHYANGFLHSTVGAFIA